MGAATGGARQRIDLVGKATVLVAALLLSPSICPTVAAQAEWEPFPKAETKPAKAAKPRTPPSPKTVADPSPKTVAEPARTKEPVPPQQTKLLDPAKVDPMEIEPRKIDPKKLDAKTPQLLDCARLSGNARR